MINTEIWTPHPEKIGVITFQGYRPFWHVYQEVEKAVNAKFKNDENIGFDYIASDWEFKAKDALWPNGYIAVFVLHGGSEAYRVNVCVMNPAEGYKQMMSAKVWSENGAHEVCKFIQRLFYFEGEIEAATLVIRLRLYTTANSAETKLMQMRQLNLFSVKVMLHVNVATNRHTKTEKNFLPIWLNQSK